MWLITGYTEVKIWVKTSDIKRFPGDPLISSESSPLLIYLICFSAPLPSFSTNVQSVVWMFSLPHAFPSSSFFALPNVDVLYGPALFSSTLVLEWLWASAGPGALGFSAFPEQGRKYHEHFIFRSWCSPRSACLPPLGQVLRVRRHFSECHVVPSHRLSCVCVHP